MKSKKNNASNEKMKDLEKIYREYMTPMPLKDWKNIRSLKQPTVLKKIIAKTVYSSGG